MKGVTLHEAAALLGVTYIAAYRTIVVRGRVKGRSGPRRGGKRTAIVVDRADLGRLLADRARWRRDVPDGWVGARAAAATAGVSAKTLANCAGAGKLSAVKVKAGKSGAEWRYDPADLMRYRAAREAASVVQAAPDPLAFLLPVPLGPSGLTVESHHLGALARRRARLVEAGAKVRGL